MKRTDITPGDYAAVQSGARSATLGNSRVQRIRVDSNEIVEEPGQYPGAKPRRDSIRVTFLRHDGTESATALLRPANILGTWADHLTAVKARQDARDRDRRRAAELVERRKAVAEEIKALLPYDDGGSQVTLAGVRVPRSLLEPGVYSDGSRVSGGKADLTVEELRDLLVAAYRAGQDSHVKVLADSGCDLTTYCGADGIAVVQLDLDPDVHASVRVNVNDAELATIHDGGNRVQLPAHAHEYHQKGAR